MTKVFVDGSAGTTGLRILDRLQSRRELCLIRLPEESRKDPAARLDAMCRSDVVFLCLPDDAAAEAVGMLGDEKVTVIDTSTAHRTSPGWVYGFPELTGQRERIRNANRIANPGCHASGFIALIAPLTERGILSSQTALSCFSLTGYSGGGKKMIAAYETDGSDPLLEAPRLYGLSQAHKHLPEMRRYSGMQEPPVFCPVVAPYYAGMEVVVPLFAEQLRGGVKAVRETYRDVYRGGLIRYAESADESGFLSAGAFCGRDDMQITVTGNEERILLVARFDNLGKGASGAAIQNMNLTQGLPETEGLILGDA